MSAPSPAPGSVIYLSHDGMLEPLGGSQVLPYVLGLARRGFRMQILSFEKPGDLELPQRKLALEEELRKRGVEWLPLPYRSNPPLLAQAGDVFRGARQSRRILASLPGPHLIHARSYVAGMMALLVHLFTGVPYIFDMRGFWIDERVEAGFWRRSSPLVSLLRRIEADLLRHASAVVVLTHRGRELLEGRAGYVPPGRVRVIPTCTDLERFHPPSSPHHQADALALRKELGVHSGPLLVYSGSLSTWYMGPETFLVARGFLAAGGGGFLVLTREVEEARRLAKQAGVKAVIRTVSHSEMPGWLKAADAGLALVRPSWAKGASAPTKVGEYLASGLAVAATAEVGDLEDHLKGSPVGFTVDSRALEAEPTDTPEEGSQGKWEAVGARLLAMALRPDRAKLAREVALREYALDRGTEAYRRLYTDILSPGPTSSGKAYA
ncbi:MAG: glycosyltransferase [Gemmatimonadota bacterium]